MALKYYKFIFTISVVSILFIFTGCSQDSSDAELIVKKEQKPNHTKEIEEQIKQIKTQKVYNKYDAIIEKVFQDNSKIGPIKQKPMIIIFGSITDPYSEQLKKDITNSKNLQEKLQNEFNAYYLKANENQQHKIYHDGVFMGVDTKTMLAIYGIQATPTIIFTDSLGKAVILQPGYIDTQKFLVTINFIQSDEWKDKNRKSIEVYEALKAYYAKNGIE